MRVIAGTAKGRRLSGPRGRSMRPTADRVKEALFNTLPHNLTGLRVLDLFAGTGGLGVEALSRGAETAYLVEASRQEARTIQGNLRSLDFLQKAKVWTMPVLGALRLLGRRGERFDLILADPPYERGLVEPLVKQIAKEGVVSDNGVLVLEHSVKEEVGESYGNLFLHDRRRYGTTRLSFFVRRGHDLR